ncbi:MAG: ATP-binding cassette domain-containing protein [Oscillibacter sp.]|nr:ATP-binding cassette domain-containing protein [Oscillibacter sp.]
MALTVQIQKRWGSFLLDVDFTAENGEALALLGASGCGKSLTLKCAAGIEKPDRGRILLNGRVLFDSARRIHLPPQSRKVGYLFQQYALFPHLTAEQNIAVACRRDSVRRTRELMALLRLKGLEKLRPRQLSGGQQQRVAIARILAAEPEAILLDEPFSALDSYLKWQLELELQDVLSRFPGPVLWVSHDRGEVYRNCRQVCVLENGKASPQEDIKTLMANPGTVSAARLSGCKNYVPVQPGPEPGQVRIPLWGDLILQCAAPWREGVTTLGIRANRVRPAEPGAQNAFPCEVVRVTEDVFAMLLMLRPAGAEGPLLRMELGKDRFQAPDRDGQLWAAVQPEDLMLLEEPASAGERQA